MKGDVLDDGAATSLATLDVAPFDDATEQAKQLKKSLEYLEITHLTGPRLADGMPVYQIALTLEAASLRKRLENVEKSRCPDELLSFLEMLDEVYARLNRTCAVNDPEYTKLLGFKNALWVYVRDYDKAARQMQHALYVVRELMSQLVPGTVSASESEN